MKKKFNSIGKVLNKEDFTVADNGTVAISNDEMQKVENHIASLENSVAEKDDTIANRDSTIAELKTQIEDLKNGAGAEDSEIVNTNETEDFDVVSRSKEMFNSVKDLF